MNHPGYLTDLSWDEFLELAESLGGKAFHGKILYKWIFGRGANSLNDVKGVPGALKEKLARRYAPYRLKKAKEVTSRDGTSKCLFQLDDGSYIETVKIPDGKRTTLCISTQVGCAAGCRFCASGLNGFERNLSTGEIVEQVLLPAGEMRDRLTNIVFMGTGEPLMNIYSLSRAIRTLNHEEGAAIGARRMTVSTMGLPVGIRKLADLGLQINLAVSLHTADEEKRRHLMPATCEIKLKEIMAACDDFRSKTTRDTTFEIMLLKGINDGLEDAHKLVELLSGRKCAVNLIPFNPVEGIPFEVPANARVQAYKKALQGARIPVTVRRSRGKDIQSACGQLRMLRDKEP